MMRIDGLSVNYGAVEALKNVSLDVPPGRVTAVIGANGAGKSTLMRTLAGLEKPLAGQVLFNDEDITGGKPEDIVRRGIALVPEGRSTISDLTVEENLKLGGMWRTHAQRATSLTRVYALFPALGERRDAPRPHGPRGAADGRDTGPVYLRGAFPAWRGGGLAVLCVA